MKEIIDEFGQQYVINEVFQKLYGYCNKKKKATYCAPIVENGKTLNSWTNYISEEIVTDLEAKLKIFLSPVNGQYASMVEYYASKNDPDGILWNEIVKYVKEHESDFFDKYGDFKRHIPVLKEVIPNWEDLIK